MTPEQKKELAEEIKKNLRIDIDTDTHVHTNQPIIIITLLWDGKEIDSSKITIGN